MNNKTPDSSASHLFEITPADADLKCIIRGLIVGGSGDISITDALDSTVIFPVIAGMIIPVFIKRVNATGTTAFSLIGMV